MMKHDLQFVGRQFCIDGEFVSASPHGSGHINDTYAAVYRQDGKQVRYVHQRINHGIFKDPGGLMENVRRVLAHIRDKLEQAGESDVDRKVLTLIPARDGSCRYVDPEGNYWRTYLFIEQAQTYDAIVSADQAREAARAFGRFQQQLADLPPPRLTETIPDFHDTRRRFDNLVRAVEADAANRADAVRAEIDFALARESMVDVLLDLQKSGDIPERITHNDTKLNNVMIDDETGEGLCVIDLDTVMPGLALYDFGDMVRTATSPAEEDERDLSKVFMQQPMFEALVGGYVEAAGSFLNAAELDHLAFSGRLITFEIGLRFLTDHLAGDVYFKVHRPDHNLDRCRTQFKLVADMEEKEDAMRAVVQKHVS